MVKKQSIENTKQGRTKKTNEVDKKLVELTDDVKRIQADFVNYKRRSEEQMNQRLRLGQQMAISALIPTLDNLERAMVNLPIDLEENAWAQGVMKSARQLASDLEKLGVRKIETVGKPFDPEFMEAVHVEGDGDNEIVLEELQSGYVLNNELLRHAVVKVERK